LIRRRPGEPDDPITTILYSAVPKKTAAAIQRGHSARNIS
jgi:hypothetical protein